MTFADVLPNAGLCAAAILCAWCCSPDDRRAALACAGLITFDWLVFVLSWTPVSLHAGFGLFGVDMPGRQIWPVIDALIGAAIIMRAFDKPWAWALWACLFAQVLLHGWRDAGLIDMAPYYSWLDRLFWGQIAVFFIIGGPGVINHVGDLVRDLARGGGGVRRAYVAQEVSARQADR